VGGADPHITESGVDVTVIAGAIGDVRAPAPTLCSWAPRPGADVAFWHVQLESGARWTLPPPAEPASVRTLFVVEAEALSVGDFSVAAPLWT
jgi:quercetin 2,3-dioxygenase